jgi:large subunit ribosomal protein L19
MAIGDVRRAKLYYLRGRVGKKARVREKQQQRGGVVEIETPLTAVEPEAEQEASAPEAEAEPAEAEALAEGDDAPEGEPEPAKAEA